MMACWTVDVPAWERGGWVLGGTAAWLRGTLSTSSLQAPATAQRRESPFPTPPGSTNTLHSNPNPPPPNHLRRHRLRPRKHHPRLLDIPPPLRTTPPNNPRRAPNLGHWHRNSLFISRTWQLRCPRPYIYRRRQRLPVQQIRVRSYAAAPTPIGWWRVGEGVDVFVPVFFLLVGRGGGLGFAGVWADV